MTQVTIYTTLLLIAAIFPLSLYSDYRKKKIADNDPEIEYDHNDNSRKFIIVFTPFCVLFFTEQFWLHLLYLVPLYAYFIGLTYFASKKGWALYMKHEISMHASSGVMMTILAYFIWFHEGILTPETSTATTPTDMATFPLVHTLWPYYAFAGLIVAIIIASLYEHFRKINTSISGKLFVVMAFANPLLPLFTHYFWWGQLAGAVVFIAVLSYMTSRAKLNVQGGMQFFMGYVYMMVLTLSVIIYAFLF